MLTAGVTQDGGLPQRVGKAPPTHGIARRTTLLAVVLSLACLCSAHHLLPSLCFPAVGLLAEPGTATVSPLPGRSPGPEPGATDIPSASPTLPIPTTLRSGPTETATVLRVLYDNNPGDPRLTAAWGFSCLVESEGGTVLFDTGGDGRILLHNTTALGIDPAAIDAVVLSHIHDDHVGGLEALLGSNDHLVVYIPASFPEEFGRQVGERARVVQVSGPMQVVPGIQTTGEMGTATVEQSLIVETARGLVIVTGCAHPGIAEIVRRAAALGEVDLVIGGFHLGGMGREDVQMIIEGFQALGVRRVAPCHCTGAEATNQFQAAFGSGFVPCGVGTTITIEP